MPLLKEVKDILSEVNLAVNAEKCIFLQPPLKYQGYVIDRDSISIVPD